MNILFIVFGKDTQHYLQSNFSIYTFLAQKKETTTINIITDRPEMYSSIANEVNLITIEESILKEWRGEFDFFWRIKIKAIQHLWEKFKNQHILYLDSDTFLFGDFSVLLNQLDNGNAFMHLCEGEWKTLKSKTEKKMWRQINNHTYGGITITAKYPMWNAGAIGIPSTHGAAIIEKTLQICDDMLRADVTRRLIEQYAFSAALANTTKLIEAQNQIGHYWSNKEDWNKFITTFFIEHTLQHHTKEEILASVKNTDFKKIPVYVDKPNTNGRLKKKIDSFFPNRKEVFIPTK
jgi:hypothetical protein